MTDLQSYLDDRLKLKDFKEKLYAEKEAKLQLAEKIKNAPPFQRPARDNAATEETFKKNSKFERDNLEKNDFILKANYITTERHSCLINMANLKETTFREMTVNKIHLGCFVECTTIALPYYVCGINLLVKDKNGDIENVVLYNYETMSYYVDPEMIVPIVTYLIF